MSLDVRKIHWHDSKHDELYSDHEAAFDGTGRNRVHPPAFPHDPIVEIFENVYLVRGSIKIGPGMRMSRNMLIVKHGEALTLINPVRLNEAELSRLDGLGKVRHVMRLGDFHGLDDPFYVERYQAKFWCQAGQSTYKMPYADTVIDSYAVPPFPDAEFFTFESATFPEAALLLKKQKLLITTDSVQYWDDWRYTSLFTQLVLRLMGFRETLLIGKPWLKRVTPKRGSLLSDFEKLMTLDFEHLVAAHGTLLRDVAKPMLKLAMAEAFSKADKKLGVAGPV